MTEFPTEALLRLENACLPGPPLGGPRSLMVSVNPDLVNDFGHFLNYEKRIREACAEAGVAYRCLANRKLTIQDPDLVPTFDHDSGHFALVRRTAAAAEDAIARQFFEALRDALARLDPDRHFERIWLFLYCGSSPLAARLVQFEWDARVHVCINAFWDFLLPDRRYAHAAVLPFQRQVRLLAMSELHSDEIRNGCGLRFDPIPNPPPLLRDAQAYDEIHAQANRIWRQQRLQVFLPGLMTMGKGEDTTHGLFRYLCGVGVPEWRFVFRDRLGALGKSASAGVSVVSGDLSDDEIAKLYRDSDFVVLPYEPGTFAVRTSGALVDALMFGAVPLVLTGTWLAHVCQWLGVGHVLPDMRPATVLQCISDGAARLPAERARVVVAAGRYLARHHWRKLVDTIAGDPYAELAASPRTVLRSEPSVLAVANRILRDGRTDDAARIYRWLQQGASLQIYERNLQLCERRQLASRP